MLICSQVGLEGELSHGMDERAKDGEVLEISGLCLSSQKHLIQIHGFLDNFFKAICFRGIGPTPNIARFPP